MGHILEAALAPRRNIAQRRERHVIANKGQLVGGQHAQEALARGCCRSLVPVKAHFPFRIAQRPDMVVGRIRDQRQLLAFAFQHVCHVARRVAGGIHRGHARCHILASLEEAETLGIGGNLLLEPLIVSGVGGVEFDATRDVGGVLERFASIAVHAANVIAMHVRQNHMGDLVSCDTRVGKGPRDAFLVEACVKQDRLRAGAHERGRKEELHRVIGNEVVCRDFRELFLGHVHAKNTLSIVARHRSRQQSCHLKCAEAERAGIERAGRCVATGSGKTGGKGGRGRCGSGGGERLSAGQFHGHVSSSFCGSAPRCSSRGGRGEDGSDQHKCAKRPKTAH